MVLMVNGIPVDKGPIADLTEQGEKIIANNPGSIWQIYDDLKVIRDSLSWKIFEDEISRLTVSQE